MVLCTMHVTRPARQWRAVNISALQDEVPGFPQFAAICLPRRRHRRRIVCYAFLLSVFLTATSKVDLRGRGQAELVCDHVADVFVHMRSLQKSVTDSAYQHTIEQLLAEKRAEVRDYEADQVSQ